MFATASSPWALPCVPTTCLLAATWRAHSKHSYQSSSAVCSVATAHHFSKQKKYEEKITAVRVRSYYLLHRTRSNPPVMTWASKDDRVYTERRGLVVEREPKKGGDYFFKKQKTTTTFLKSPEPSYPAPTHSHYYYCRESAGG